MGILHEYVKVVAFRNCGSVAERYYRDVSHCDAITTFREEYPDLSDAIVMAQTVTSDDALERLNWEEYALSVDRRKRD